MLKKVISKNAERNLAIATALLSAGFLVQACGHGSSSGVASAVTAAGSPPPSGVVSTQQNSALYNACTNLSSCYQAIPYASQCTAQLHQASDGANTCEVNFEQGIDLSGGRAFLGPTKAAQYGLYDAEPTQINANPHDSISVNVSGNETSSSFCSPGDGSSISGLAYGWILGVSYFQLNGVQVPVPANGGGTLYLGLDQTQGAGCMTMQGYAQITRCVDSAGNPHPC